VQAVAVALALIAMALPAARSAPVAAEPQAL